MGSKLKKTLESEIILWNNKFPLDYWWRQKYGISFGSKAHREMSFLDIYRDFLEDQMFKKQSEKAEDKAGVGKKMSQSEIDEDFDNIDLSKY